MIETNPSLETLQDIKNIMERSSRFISLSGLSGISAGICALIGAGCAYSLIEKNKYLFSNLRISVPDHDTLLDYDLMNSRLIQIAILTFISAFLLAFIFTYRRSVKTNVPVWGATARRLMINVSVPMITGGIFLIAMLEQNVYGLVAPGCLIFYGLGILNASKYTFPETRCLAYSEILLGLINLLFIGEGLYFWAAGFGILHILYGTYMWWKYEYN